MDPTDLDSDPGPQHWVKVKEFHQCRICVTKQDPVLFKKHLVSYVYNTGKTITNKYLLQVICVMSSRQ